MLLYFTRSPNLVIFVKVIFVIFDFENEKKFYKEYIYIDIYLYIYILYRSEKCFCFFENDKNDFDKNDTLSLLRWLTFNGFVTT